MNALRKHADQIPIRFHQGLIDAGMPASMLFRILPGTQGSWTTCAGTGARLTRWAMRGSPRCVAPVTTERDRPGGSGSRPRLEDVRPVRTTHSRAWSQHDDLMAVDAASWSGPKSSSVPAAPVRNCTRGLRSSRRFTSPPAALLGRSKVWRVQLLSWGVVSSEG